MFGVFAVVCLIVKITYSFTCFSNAFIHLSQVLYIIVVTFASLLMIGANLISLIGVTGFYSPALVGMCLFFFVFFSFMNFLFFNFYLGIVNEIVKFL